MNLYPINRLVYKRFLKTGFTLGVAESCTGGLLADTITDIPGSSAYFKGGVVAYHPEVKTSLLHVDPGLLERPGVVSAEVAKAMALSSRKIFSADLGVGITGVAGPGGGTPGTPVGLVYIAASGKGLMYCRRFYFMGSRAVIKRCAVRAALHMLRRVLRAK